MSNPRYNSYESSKPLMGSSDKPLLIIVIFLVVIGVMAIFSAGAPKCIAAGVNPARFAIVQIIAIVLGYFALMAFREIDYKDLAKYAVPFSIFVIFLLFLVNFTPLGHTVYGATRWIKLGPVQIQPSEFAKPAVIALLSCAFCNDVNIWDSRKISKYFIPIAIMAFLIFLQPNLSMVLILMAISVVMYISAGGSLGLVVGASAFGVLVLKKFMHSYQMSRIEIWKNPEIDPLGAGYNIIQSLLAFAAGGFAGTGFGNSKQKLAWLPEGHTDFIFAVIAEEMGFVGCVFLILIFIAFIVRGLYIASRCTNMFGKLMATGITLSIGIQAFINMAVSSSLIPATGVTMPFISYGGSSIVVSLAMIGVLLNISRKRIRKINAYERAR